MLMIGNYSQKLGSEAGLRRRNIKMQSGDMFREIC